MAAENQGFVNMEDNSVVLLKFIAKKLESIPEGILLREAGNRDSIHAQDAIELNKKHLASLDRYRPGRVDTGEMVLHALSTSWSLQSIRAAGFQLVDLHYYRNVKTEKYIIQMVFSNQVPKGEGITFKSLSDREANAIRALEVAAWELWAWDNSAIGNPVTLNFTGRHEPRFTKNPASTTQMLRIKDSIMQLYDK